MPQSESSGGGGGGDGDIYRLPEECISHAIAFTLPRDACRSAAVSTTFRSAATSDIVWGRFLPPDCESILARAVLPVEYSSLSKRELFLRLCDLPVLIDDGNMSFALDKTTKAKCFIISARKLTIIWGSTPKYWRWIQLTDSRFVEVAELLAVCWLEIRGRIESKMLSPKTLYAAFLIYKLAAETYGLHYPSQEASVKLGAHSSINRVLLDPTERRRTRFGHHFNRHANEEETAANTRAPQVRSDGWMEMELGEFYNDDGEDGEVDIILMGIEGGHWKKGLLIQGIEIKPKKVI